MGQDDTDDLVLPPNAEERLLELLDDSPMNDEPLTPAQEDAIDRLMGEPIPETEEELEASIRAAQERSRRPLPA